MSESATRIPARVLHDFTVHVRKHDAIIHYLALRSQGGKVRSSWFNKRCRTYFTKNQKNVRKILNVTTFSFYLAQKSGRDVLKQRSTM